MAHVLLALSLVGFAVQTADARLNAVYVFGDSTVDVGNNNFLPDSTARANFTPYGIDFPGGTPTGRFSNGFNTADELAKLFGFPMSPPPFLSLTSRKIATEILKGINFASGGSGIHDETGKIFGKVIPMGMQVQHFANVTDNMKKLIGSDVAAEFLSNCLFFISAGSNDIFEYSYAIVGPNETMFISSLTTMYQDHMRALYDLGARKFGIISAPPLGCCPSQRVRNKTGDCYEQLNDLSRKFYQAIGAVLEDLHSELQGMKYALGNSYGMVSTIFENPLLFNITNLKDACCGYGEFNGEYGCNSTFPYCVDRTNYLFWDRFHPTQSASTMAAKILYGGPFEFVTPINFKELIEDDS